MKRRNFIVALAAGAAGLVVAPDSAPNARPKLQLDITRAYLKPFPLNSPPKAGYLCLSSCANMLPWMSGFQNNVEPFTLANLLSIAEDAPTKPIYYNCDESRRAGFVVRAKVVADATVNDGVLFGPEHHRVDMVSMLDADVVRASCFAPLYTVVTCLVSGPRFNLRFDKLLSFGITTTPIDQKLNPVQVVTPEMFETGVPWSWS